MNKCEPELQVVPLPRGRRRENVSSRVLIALLLGLLVGQQFLLWLILQSLDRLEQRGAPQRQEVSVDPANH